MVSIYKKKGPKDGSLKLPIYLPSGNSRGIIFLPVILQYLHLKIHLAKIFSGPQLEFRERRTTDQAMIEMCKIV